MAAAGFSSCSLLDTEVLEQPTADTFYMTPSDINQAVNGIYSAYGQVPFYTWHLVDGRSDETWVTGSDILPYHTFNGTTMCSHKYNLGAWTQLYTVVVNANKVINTIDNIAYLSNDAKNQQKGEAYFLRALAYFDLVRLWGNVPISTDVLTVNASMTVKQSTPAEVYALIESDLKTAIELLNDNPTTYDGKSTTYGGQATKSAAKALMGRVLMMEAGYPMNITEKYAEAMTYLKEVIDYSEQNGNKWWVDTQAGWNEQWLHENDNKNFIFEVQYTNVTDLGNPVTIYTTPTYYDNSYSRKLSVYGCEPSVQLFGNEDEGIDYRKDFTYDTESSDVAFIWKWVEADAKRAKAGYSSYKSSISDATMYPQNYPIIRFEDVLLLYAEACLATGNDLGNGLKYFNKVYTRRWDDAADRETYAKTAYTLDDIKTERRMEFVGEGIRWYDMVRWNTYVDDIKSMFEHYINNSTSTTAISNYRTYINSNVGTHINLLPIPYNQLHIVEGLYKQNPGF